MGDAALDVFDGDTAVGDGTVPRDALRTDAMIPVVSLPRQHTDKIARRRGLSPIGEPYVRQREVVRVARGWFYFALALSIASLVAMASVVMWSRDEVRGAHAAAAIAPPPPPRVETRIVPAVVTPPPECAPPMTELTLESKPPGAKVSLDGREIGTTPMVATVPRYQPGFFEFRVPGRATARKRIVPNEPAEQLRVTLQRRR
jgi:hypothetical protein